MPLKILGLNHNTAPVEIREQVVYAESEAGRALRALLTLDGVDEAMVMSTCNRTEFYLEADDHGLAQAGEWLRKDQNMDPATAASLFTLDGDEAIVHLFRVACGLESMILGEPQILGQLKDAYRLAEKNSAIGKSLGRVFRHTFSVAKKVRTDTRIGASPVSVAYAAVNLANQFFSGFSQHTALVIGAGQTIRLVAQHLHSKGIGRLFVANRNISRAKDLASEFSGFALPLSELEGTLPEADILISSTASPDPIVTVKDMQAAIRARKRRPVFAVDIAVPRDLEPEIGDLDDVYLYSVDDLDKVIVEGQGNRAAAAQDAERILQDETRRYLEIERGMRIAPLITALREQGDALRQDVLAQARRRLRQGADSQEVVEYATAALMKKMLHAPSVRLREAGEDADDAFIATARTLFDLNNNDED
ncbi:glutamyl-tRNA reductase [Woeseia oceani]|uniref:Glutamyl-tRNA reductase n=1 Tax=Woeseia oceani TaxID=1548547 RepID=A0A193LHI7_9GAMM|nr:glutamyl-tRNA reductase [Woeseia oceani]ANO51918.1 glutamyl-tRNA reductase [Woeseia oceani]